MRFDWVRIVGWIGAHQTTVPRPRLRFARNPTWSGASAVGLRANDGHGLSRTVWGALTQPTVLALLLIHPTLALAAPLKVVASFTILADMVRQVAGPHAEVIALVGPGGDTHTFDPSPADAGKLGGADLIVVNGLGLDGWMERLAKAADLKVPILTASVDVAPRQMTEAGQTVPDPHAWQDPRNGGMYLRAIALALKTADPAHATTFTDNTDRLTAALEALDQNARQQIAGVPVNRRRIITSHDAFGYFGRAYGVSMLAPEGISTDQEPSAGAVARIIDQIRSQAIGTVFIENMANPRLIETIRTDTGATDGGTLYSDSLSPPDGPAPTYLAMLRYNISKLVAAMKGS